MIPDASYLRNVLVEPVAGGPVKRHDLDVCLAAGRPYERVVGPAAQQQAHRLRHDRLAGPGLARDDVQARRELELRGADQHEVVDAEAVQHEGP